MSLGGLALPPVRCALRLRLRLERLDAHLEIDERLQILMRNAFLGELGNQHMQTLGAERGLISRVGQACIGLSERPERRAEAID